MKTELSTGETPSWFENIQIDGRTVSTIEWKNDMFNIFRKEDWPGMISFLKDKILVMDRFWALNKEVLESL